MYDIGANIGLVSIPIARNEEVHVVSFEPDSHNCSLLRANIAMSGVDIEVVNAAVAAEPGEMYFTKSAYNSGDHRLSERGTVAVRTVSLDDYPPPPGPFAVKIDTQGAEPEIIRGGGAVLSKADLIVCEFWPWGMRRMSLAPDTMVAFAERHFNRGMVLKHDQEIGDYLPIAEVIDQLWKIVQAGGEHDAADLVLVR